ncbi:hypothetical protein EN828_17105 [Mesorhizobium sp. M2D.F.Ca.ET.185.01.1.1]|uniref:hypothetical protein n=1 Tax=unclassified Mesorhizobium TaxID=325217 RepID=UPI000FCB6228|nr:MULTISPECIES: hypothetical protein [unclassified Mesorhizobium]TGP79169.1 hypothetical protein EN870_13425 [bacterium M00.F.Ca.ET.227.01.1.1]TGQ01093.1 hypothetical protein EN864_03815 [bacterium M00.F.Ca.ET.221.01.1.1]TGQ02389.1 hypothetical protein EN865_00090 [bacterium M00.F.Ca.ET.222.01.1.1]TGT75643.1 hypothetical protein EN802_05230 [bacterium M00.F.Ca.ET.159.01.1.1]TGT81487.1 hypothetical protein EN800_21720 [bacterium M00.F.Ca.ET.157.01.1.1]TGU12286.1 hypothetical protein EN806_178
MSDDPETARQIEELAADDRPLLVLDVDDVLLEFIRPFPHYLKSRGFGLTLASFRLTGNIAETATGRLIEQPEVTALLGDFFDAQADWQSITDGAADALAMLSRGAEIILLTAMPHKHRAVRRTHLDALGLDYPLLTTEMAKGPAIAKLRGAKGRPVAFVDDQPSNLVSARSSVADAHLFHLMADNALRAFLPPTPEDIISVDNWREAAPKIAAALGL